MEVALGRYGQQSPAAGGATLAAGGGRPSVRTGGSPTSDGLRSDTVSTDAAEYSEHARLVNSALSDDGMTPLIQPGRTRGQKALQIMKRLLAFCLSHWSKAAIMGFLITLIVLVSIKGFGIFGDVLGWFQRHNGWAGWGIFVGMYTAMVALFLPGVVLILGSGFVFGFWRGLLAVWAGGAVGQALAFLLARYLFRDWVESTLRTKWRKWAIIDKAIEHDGWKLVLIMRFSPIIPYNLLNIAMATTSIPFWQFTIVSAVGIVYECAVFAYFGSMADNIHAVVSGEGGLPSAVQWVMLGISLLMCVVGAAFVSYSIKQAIRRAQQHHSLSAADLEGGAATDEEDAELGVRLHPSYPASLEREGFVGGGGSSAGSSHHNNSSSGNGYSSLARPSSPEFELRVVGASSSADGAAAAATARDKARLLGGSGGLERSTLLTLTAASGSGSLHLPGLSGGLGGASATRTTSAKLKTSPKASMDRLDADSLQRRYSAAAEGGSGGGEDGTDPGTAAAVARAVRRHPSSGGESML